MHSTLVVNFIPLQHQGTSHLRNFMEELRGCGVDILGPSSLSQADRQAFASKLDWFLTRQLKLSIGAGRMIDSGF